MTAEDASAELIEKVREQLASLDRAVPTMELSLAMNVSAQLASRLLARVESTPEVRTLTDVRARIDRPPAALERSIVQARSWDDAVHQVEATGVARTEARAMVDWVVLDMAIESYLAGSRFGRGLRALAELLGDSPEETRRAGAAGAFARLAAAPLDRLAVTRALVTAVTVSFSEAFLFVDAIGDMARGDALLRGCASVDGGDVAGAAALWASSLGLSEQAATHLARGLARTFAA